MYADYPFYVETYKGCAIAEQDFERLITRAESYLHSIISIDGYTDSDAVKMAECAVAEAWQVNEQGGEIAAQTVGKWSRTYQSKKGKSDNRRLFDAAKLYLGNHVQLARWC